MAYRADITQDLKPSAPDISGAVGAIQAQAGIAKTLFGGIAEGLGMYKQQMGEELLAKSEELAKSALTTDELAIEQERQATADLMKARGTLGEYQAANMGPMPEGMVSKVSAEPAYKADVEAAASRLALVKADGRISQSEYFMRVSRLVDEYAAKYPGSKTEIRKIVEQGTGLPGADLWAQRQFIDRLYSPQQKSAKAQEDAMAQERTMIFDKLGIPPTNILSEQQINSEQYQLWKSQASQVTMSQAQSESLKKELERQTTAADVNFANVSDTSRRLALARSGVAVGKYTASLGQEFNDLNVKLTNNTFTSDDLNKATGYISNMKNLANKEFSSAILEIQALPVGAGVSQTAKDNAIKNIKTTQDAIISSLDTSDISLVKNIMQIYTSSAEKNLDLKSKYVAGMTTFVKLFGKDDVIAGLLSVPEVENNVVHPRWKQIIQSDPGLAEAVRQLKREIGSSPIEMAGRLISTSPLGQAMTNATTSPGPTPIMPGESTAQQKTMVSAVNERATNLAVSFKTAAGAVQQTWQGSQLQERQAAEIAGGFVLSMKDLNLCSTAMCNAANGNAIQKIAANKVAWKDLYSKLQPEQKMATQQAVSFEVENALESARKDLVDVNKRYKTNLQFGVDAKSKTYGIVPPPIDKFYDPLKINPGQINQPALAQMQFGREIPEPFKKYYPRGMLVKPEFVEEINNLGKAAKEWNNRNIPKVAGSFISQASVTGEDEFAIAQNFMRSVDSSKPITGFFTIPTPQAAPAGTTATGGGVATQPAGAVPKTGDSERVLTLRQEISKTDENIQIANKRLKRAMADDDMEDVAFYEDQIKRASADATSLQRELKSLQKEQGK